MSRKLIHYLNVAFRAINSTLSKKPKAFYVLGRALIATALGFFMSTLLVEPLSMSTSAIFSSPEKRDFQMSDLFAQIADNRPVRSFDDRVVVVNIGNGTREDITDALSVISLCGPKAVGVDINFADHGNNDHQLIESLKALPNLILPLGIKQSEENGKFEIEDKPFFFDEESEFNYGIVNLPLKVNKGTVREYAIEFPTNLGVYLSFSTALAQIADPEAMKKLKERGSKTGITAYHSREYLTLNLDEIEDNAESLFDKIVILGALDESYDMHSTPVKSHVSGVMIHSYALSTVLDGIWFHKIPKMFDYLLAFLVCLGIMIVVYGFKSNFKGIVLRIIQGILVFLAVRIGYSLFVDHSIIFDLSYTVLIIAFGLFAADIWNGLEALWNIGSKKIQSLDSRKWALQEKKNQLC